MKTKQELIQFLLDRDSTMTEEEAEKILMDQIAQCVRQVRNSWTNIIVCQSWKKDKEFKIDYWFTYPEDVRGWL
jgi:hypothetical protein